MTALDLWCEHGLRHQAHEAWEAERLRRTSST
jgi:hypothetical protein